MAQKVAMTRLGIVVNPTSGRGRGLTEGHEAVAAFAAAGIELLDLSAGDYLSASANAKAAVANRSIDALVVQGGDGMFHLGVNACAESAIPLGLIASGTGNDSAQALGLPIHDVKGGVQRIISAFESPRKVDVIRSKSDSKEFFSFGAVSAGFDALVNARANRWTALGQARYKISMYAELAAFKPIHYQLTVDGVERELEAILCTVTNTTAYGGGMMIAPSASFTDGELDLFILHSISRLELIKLFPSVYTGEHIKHPAVEILRAKIVRIESSGMPAYSDGEHVGASPVDCQVETDLLRVLA